MRPGIRAVHASALLAIGVAAFALFVARVGSSPARAAPVENTSTPSAEAHGVPVLVELFTSEGCSSCPPADAVLEHLSRAPSVRNGRAVVLAHHVDYWNDLGWPDPFSSAAASSRQRGYALLGGGTYTPQMVVDGSAQVVGSRSAAVHEAIAASSARPHASVELGLTPATERGAFEVTVRVGALPDSSAKDAEVVLAVVQDHARVAVVHGENAGRTLDHVAIVRSLQSLGPVALAGGAPRTVVRPPSGIEAPDGSPFSVVAFVQERGSRRVLGSGTRPLALSGASAR
jgi:hypothetical protein